MKIVLEKYEGMEDWYSIVRQEHDGREWMEQTGPNSGSWRMSKRVSDACVEGDSYEMLAIAHAIKNLSDESFRRCAVHFETDGVHFHSPRNSSVDGVCTIEEAEEFANQVIAELTD